MSKELRILGIAGSLRKGSYNKGALRSAVESAPADVKIEIFDIAGIPVFNEDDEEKPPQIVVQFKAAIRAADAILIATPEYNYSIPGGLKNAIDWGSRPYGDSAWKGKPVAIMGASAGMLGTGRAQYALRQVFVTLDMPALTQPEVLIANASDRFDDDGNLKDQKSKDKIKELAAALAAWTRRLQKGAA